MNETTAKPTTVRIRTLAASATKPQRLVAETYSADGVKLRRVEFPWDYSMEYSEQAHRLAWRLIGRPTGRAIIGEWDVYLTDQP